MVAQWIAGVVLHVADQGVVPVDDVERAVGCEFEVHWAEVGIGGFEQILAKFGFVADSVIDDRMLFNSEKPDVVAKQHIALNFVGEMAGGNELKPGGGAHRIATGGEVGRRRSLTAVGGLDRCG